MTPTVQANRMRPRIMRLLLRPCMYCGWSGLWGDQRIAEAFGCRRQTVEGIRQRFVEAGFESTVHGKPRDKPPTEKILSGKQEARLIAMRLGPPPKGYANWTLRLLARRVVELKIAPAASHETVRRTLKKMT